jgi:hypothetical protein
MSDIPKVVDHFEHAVPGAARSPEELMTKRHVPCVFCKGSGTLADGSACFCVKLNPGYRYPDFYREDER